MPSILDANKTKQNDRRQKSEIHVISIKVSEKKWCEKSEGYTILKTSSDI